MPLEEENVPQAGLFYGFWEVGPFFSNVSGGVNLFGPTQGPFFLLLRFCPFKNRPSQNMVLDSPLST